MKRRLILFILILIIGSTLMKARDILNNTDPQELRNIVYRLQRRQAEAQTPPLSEVTNESPEQFPSTTTEEGNSLGWFNVRDYGAIGDGVTDDTEAVSAAIEAMTAADGGVLYFPEGQYLTSGGFTITVDATIRGDGPGLYLSSSLNYALSQVLSNSATTSLFTINADTASVEDIGLVNIASSTPSAGAGITVTSSNVNQRVNYDNIQVHGFYVNIDVQVGTAWSMNNCVITAPVLYGFKIQNSLNQDSGDWSIVSCWFSGFTHNSSAGIRVEGSGGGKIINCKINGAGSGNAFLYGIDVASGFSGTGNFLVTNNSIENVRSHGIKIDAPWHDLVISSNQFGLSYNTGNNVGNAINISGSWDGITITGNSFTGGSSPTAIAITSVNDVVISGNVNRTFSALLSQASSTNVVVVVPGSGVTAETSYGLSSSVGSSANGYANADHTHGSPSLSTSTPAEVGSAGAAGSGTTPSKDDHVHKGVHSLAKSGDTALYGDVTLSAGTGVTITRSSQNIEIAASSAGIAGIVMETGTTFPPVPLTNEEGTDWIYAEP